MFRLSSVAVHVTVVDPLPLFQQGAAAALSAAGYSVDTTSDLARWTSRHKYSVVLLTLCSERDWAHLARFHDRFPTQAVIALVEDDSVASGVRAVRTGAQSVQPRTVVAGALERVVAATIDGQAVMPAAVASALAANTSAADAQVPLATHQLSWLRRLAAGETVTRLASDVGYSERAMYRLLRSMYHSLGARDRLQAILLAQERGWLDVADSAAGGTGRDGGADPHP